MGRFLSSANRAPGRGPGANQDRLPAQGAAAKGGKDLQGDYLQQIEERPLTGVGLRRLEAFLQRQGLRYDSGVEYTVLYYDSQGNIAATGSLQKNVLKCIAVAEECRGEGLTASVVSTLRAAAFSRGQQHLFLFTKPQNQAMFQDFGFYPVSSTQDMLLMENKKGGIDAFVASLEKGRGEQVAIVANCNPFTLGHRYLVETAAARCDTLHLFVLSEDASLFPSRVRMELVRRGVADLANVIVHPTSDYLISAATFPTYFLKSDQIERGAGGALDLAVFGQHFAPALGITRRFVGQEPFSPITALYNRQMQEILPRYGVEVVEIPRRQIGGQAVSASRVRALLAQGQMEEVKALVPPTTWDFLQTEEGQAIARRAGERP